jgi:hypothetical protein
VTISSELQFQTLRLLSFLRATHCLPPALCGADLLLTLVPPVEVATVLLACWRFCHRFPPTDDQYDDTCNVRTYGVAATNSFTILQQPIRVCIANHIAILVDHVAYLLGGIKQ